MHSEKFVLSDLAEEQSISMVPPGQAEQSQDAGFGNGVVCSTL